MLSLSLSLSLFTLSNSLFFSCVRVDTMWQVLLAAAVAGSGFYAKRLLHINAGDPISPDPLQSTQNINQPEPDVNHHFTDDSSHLQISSPSRDPNEDGDKHNSNINDESIFRFSSASSSSNPTGNRIGPSNLRKKSAYHGSRGNVEKKRGNMKKKKSVKLGENHDQRQNGKRFAVCLKKRRTSRNSSASKDNPSFGWGLGVGIMYMMSAGKAEISRLNTVMDETAKVVQELKAEIGKRKSQCTDTNSTQLRISRSNNGNCDDEVECTSSVVTEELQLLLEPEMDQLEAELESEFEKLPLILKTEEVQDQYTNGVKPKELDQKLCHLLIERQEGQIVELETELQQTNSKLSEKEAQLQALKDCVRRLTHVSLATASDEETEHQLEDKICDGVFEKIGMESKISTVGIKRTMDFESCG